MDLRETRLVVELPVDRDRLGLITLSGAHGHVISGPFPIATRSSDSVARENGNASRNPLLRYGDTPTGGFEVAHLLRSGRGTPFPVEQFGANGVIVLEPQSGAAALAEANGRFRFLIRGGALAANGQLISTAGSLRLANRHQRALFVALQKSRRVHCEIVESSDLADQGAVFADVACGDVDPLDLAIQSPVRSQLAPKRPATLDGLRTGAGAAAGAMIFGFSVSFVATANPTVAQASVPTVSRRSNNGGDTAQAPQASDLPAPFLVRLAYNSVERPASRAEPDAQQQAQPGPAPEAQPTTTPDDQPAAVVQDQPPPDQPPAIAQTQDQQHPEAQPMAAPEAKQRAAPEDEPAAVLQDRPAADQPPAVPLMEDEQHPEAQPMAAPEAKQRATPEDQPAAVLQDRPAADQPPAVPPMEDEQHSEAQPMAASEPQRPPPTTEEEAATSISEPQPEISLEADPSSTMQEKADASLVKAEVAAAVGEAPKPEAPDYTARMDEIAGDVLKHAPKEYGELLVDGISDAAREMKEAAQAEKYAKTVKLVSDSDLDLKVVAYGATSTILKGVNIGLTGYSEFQYGNQIGTAINDLSDGKISAADFVQKVGPIPAKILLTAVGVPFTDEIVDGTVATLNKYVIIPDGVFRAVDAGMSLIESYNSSHAPSCANCVPSGANAASNGSNTTTMRKGLP